MINTEQTLLSYFAVLPYAQNVVKIVKLSITGMYEVMLRLINRYFLFRNVCRNNI